VIHEVEYEKSNELVQEMEFFETQEKESLVENVNSPQDYYRKWTDKGRYSSLRYFFNKKCEKPLKIMDIGVGFGATSIYLASLGHQITVVEPSSFSCLLIEELSSRFHLNIEIYSCASEAIDKIPVSNYDICIFDASLHHSDDPIKSLRNCYEKLKIGGLVYLLDELRIPFYLSKERFHQKLLADPIGTGNYGGNEHPYYHNEYVSMLRAAGFEQISEVLPEYYYQPRHLIRLNMDEIVFDQYIYSDTKIIVRYIIYLVLSKIVKNSYVISFLKSLSLIGMNFVAVKIS
jgi:SAM-dependent methyltransferase